MGGGSSYPLRTSRIQSQPKRIWGRWYAQRIRQVNSFGILGDTRVIHRQFRGSTNLVIAANVNYLWWLLPDGWTVVTKDHSLSAQWEHTCLVTRDGVEVLTLGADSRSQ